MRAEMGLSPRGLTSSVRRVGLAVIIGLLLPGLLPGVAAASDPAGTGSDRLTATTYPSRFQPGTSQSATVKVADWQAATVFNPYLIYATSDLNVVSVSEGSLVRITDDLKYEPDEATAVPTVANGGVVPHHDGSVTVKWKLRSGLKWSDGTPLTCDDFAYTLSWILKPTNQADKSGVLTQAGFSHWIATNKIRPADVNLRMDCLTARSMVWNLKEPYARFLALLPNPLPKHYLSTFPVADTFNGEGYLADELPNVPVSGPFKFDAVTADGINLSRNADYLDALTGGPAYLAHLDFVWYGDKQSMIDDYQASSSAFDVGLDLTQADVPSLAGVNDVLASPAPYLEHLTLNWSASHCTGLQAARGGACPLADPAFREALDYATDKNAVKAAAGGHVVPTDSLFLPDAWFSAPPAARSFDLAKAGNVLNAAGWALDTARSIRFRDFNGDGKKDGKDYDAKILACTSAGNPTRLAELQSIAASLAEVGIRVKIKTVDAASVLFAGWSDATPTTPCNIYRGNYDIADFAYVFSPDDLYGDLYYTYDSSQIPTRNFPDGSNAGRINVPRIDTAIATLGRSMDADAVFSAMKTFQQLFHSKTGEIPLYFRQDVQIADPHLRNISDDPATGGPLWNVQHWWFAP